MHCSELRSCKPCQTLHGTPQDLKTAFPELGRGLQQLLDFEGDVENTFLRTFEVEEEVFGELQRTELKPGGTRIPVTAANRAEFVQLYTDYTLNQSIARQFTAFSIGFHQVQMLHDYL